MARYLPITIFSKPGQKLLFCLIFLSFFCLTNTAQCSNGNRQHIYFITLFQSSWHIFQIAPDGTDPQQLPVSIDTPQALSITANSNRLLITDYKNDLLAFDGDSGTKSRVTIDMQGIGDSVISKDWKTLLFSLSTGGSNDANHIWLANLKTKQITQLTHMQDMQYNPIWSSDEKSIFFLSGDGGQTEDIWRMDTKSGALNQLTSRNSYNFELACSIDDELAFSSNRSGNYEIWTMDPFGGNIRQLTHNPAMDSQPSWSPDGQHLVFVSTREGEPALFIMDREGKNTRRLTPEGMVCRNPVWSH